MAERSAKSLRSSHWTFLLYPGDSAPEDWEKRLRDTHIPMLISPLHSPDPTGAGEERKPHRHVITFFSRLKSYQQADEIRQLVNGTRPEIVGDITGLGPYLIHYFEGPEKQHWTDEELTADPVIGTCGLVYESMLLDWIAKPDEILTEIYDFIEEADVFSTYELMKYARENNKVWARFLNKRTIAIDIYLKSRLWTKTKQEEALFQYQQAKAAAEKARQEKHLDDPDLLADG